MPEPNNEASTPDGQSQPVPRPSEPDPQTVDRYNAGLDQDAWDYDAAAEGRDEVTQAMRELQRRKYNALGYKPQAGEAGFDGENHR